MKLNSKLTENGKVCSRKKFLGQLFLVKDRKMTVKEVTLFSRNEFCLQMVSAAMLAVKRSVGVAQEVNLRMQEGMHRN